MNEDGYGIYFVTESQRIRLPVNPENLKVSYEGENSTYNVAGIGEVIVPRLPKLAKVSIESFFPRNSYFAGAVSNSWYRPRSYVKFFRSLQTSKAVFRFIVNRKDHNKQMFDTNFKAILSNFDITDKGGESGDVYYSLEVIEYKNAEPKKLEIVSIDDVNSTTNMTGITQREKSDQEFCVDDPIQVTGPVYELAELAAVAGKAKAFLNNARLIVSRVLPPDSKDKVSKIYAEGVGWVNKSDCVKSNQLNAAYGMQDLMV